MKRCSFLILLVVLSQSLLAQKFSASKYDFPDPVDTKTRDIAYQDRKIFEDEEGGVYVRNDFPAGRVNDFQRLSHNLYELSIKPENQPINMSPWYAFKIWSKEKKRIWVQFTYEHGQHRYIPKLSKDGDSWEPVGEEQFTFVKEGSAVMNIEVSADTLWVAAQEIMDSRRVGDWCEALATDARVGFATVGKTTKGRDLFFMDINNGKTRKKDIVAIISRQHPPEVTGFLALQAF